MKAPGLFDKICSREDAVRRIADLPRPVVFTNGVFDVLHRGHVAYLHEARAQGASLVVAVNTDRSARLLGKGPERPLNAEQDRAAVLAGPASVVALMCGWITTEVGRQPWIVYRVMRVEEAVTGASGVPLGYATVAVVYAALTVIAVALLRRVARTPLDGPVEGPESLPRQEAPA